MHYGTCFLCGKKGFMEAHHVFPAALRDKSEKYGYVVSLCGETCHRNGKKAAHSCKETSDRLKRFSQVKYMQKYNASAWDFSKVFDKNRIELDELDERGKLMNNWTGNGRLTQDPVLRHTKEGQAVCSFTVAVKRPGTKNKVDFFDFTAWNETANFISKYFKRGKGIEICGYLIRDDYEKEGEKIRSWKITVKDVGFWDTSTKDVKTNEEITDEDVEPEQSSGFSEVIEQEDDDLPF